MDPTDVDQLLGRKHFFTSPYGRGQWASLWADTALDWDFITDLLRRSYRVVALKHMISTLEKSPSRP